MTSPEIDAACDQAIAPSDNAARSAYLCAAAGLVMGTAAAACATGAVVFAHAGRNAASLLEGSAALVWLWACVATVMLCASFVARSPRLFARTREGRIGALRATTLAPVLVGASFWNATRQAKHAPCNEIVAGLWLGDRRAASERPWSLVLDLTCEYTTPSTETSPYVCLPCLDGTRVTAPVLREAAQRIDQALLEPGARVLVHCARGRWRSAQAVAFWLCTHQKLSPAQAWALLKAQRAQVKTPRRYSGDAR